MPDSDPRNRSAPDHLDANAHVLVVDDEPTLRLGFRLALLTEGYEVDEAGDGEEAVARVDQVDFDLMVLDLRMPNLDGIGVMRRLATVGTIPTVIASAQLNSKVILEALRLGVVDFLQKPVKPGDLRGVTRDVLVEEAAYANASATPLQKARCLLRRRRPADALAALAKVPGTDEGELWSSVARCLDRSADALPGSVRPEQLFGPAGAE